MPAVIVFDPGDVAPVEIDWADALNSTEQQPVTLQAVVHTLPSGLTKVGETFSDDKSYVGISGAVHGSLYDVEAQATLSITNPDGTPQILNRQFRLRGWNS